MATAFTIELKSDSPGLVTGRLVDPESGIIYEVTLATDSTRVSQKRVLANIADHLNWFVDLSHGGTK